MGRTEREEAMTIRSTEDHFKRQLIEARSRLNCLREDQRACNDASSFDERFSEQLKKLTSLLEEEENTVGELQRSNAILEELQQHLEGENDDLEKELRQLLSQGKHEGDLVDREERLTVELRSLRQREQTMLHKSL